MYANDEQKTDEWLKARAGKKTASRIKDVLAVSKRDGTPLKAREDYAGELVTERLTREPITLNPNIYSLKWGNDNEPSARLAYEIETASFVSDCGFIDSDELSDCGASPDGLVGDDGLVEIKCPVNSVNHLKTLLSGMPDEHRPQIQSQLFVTGRQWCDFISYDPRFPEHLRTYIQRIERDDDYITALRDELIRFENEIQTYLTMIENLEGQ